MSEASSLDQKRHIHGRRHANLSNRKRPVGYLGWQSNILDCILKHPTATPPAPIVARRTPPTAPVIRVDAINLASLHSQLRGQRIGLLFCGSNRHRSRSISMLAQLQGAKLNPVDVIDAVGE